MKETKPVLKQLHLDFGQRDIGLVTCSKCGMTYQHQEEDEKTHRKHCKANTLSLQLQQELDSINLLMRTDPVKALDASLRKFLAAKHLHPEQQVQVHTLSISSSGVVVRAIEIESVLACDSQQEHSRRQPSVAVTTELLLSIVASIPEIKRKSRNLFYSGYEFLSSKQQQNHQHQQRQWRQNTSLIFIVNFASSSNFGEFAFDSILGVILFSKFSRFVATEIITDDQVAKEKQKQERKCNCKSDEAEDGEIFPMSFDFSKENDQNAEGRDEPSAGEHEPELIQARRFSKSPSPEAAAHQLVKLKQQRRGSDLSPSEDTTSTPATIIVRGTTSYGIILDASPIPDFIRDGETRSGDKQSDGKSNHKTQPSPAPIQQKSVASFFGGGTSSPSFSLGQILNSTKQQQQQQQHKSGKGATSLFGTKLISSFFTPQQRASSNIRERISTSTATATNDDDSIHNNKNNNNNNAACVTSRSQLFFSSVLAALCKTLKLADPDSFLASRSACPFGFASHLFLQSSSSSSSCASPSVLIPKNIIQATTSLKLSGAEREVVPSICVQVFSILSETTVADGGDGHDDESELARDAGRDSVVEGRLLDDAELVYTIRWI